MREKGLIHGADYYPEQWLHMPEILDEDIRLMKLAQINAVSLGVFAWAALEPREGYFRFEWLDRIMDRLNENGISVILATPSGARPAWLARAYPEVLQVAPDRQRNLYGMRMNHCYTSPKYRELTKRIDEKLAERYGEHPALIAWHISNEYHGECHCPLCQEAFREFLREKYHTLEALNDAWWTGFWSKTFTEWEQIESPSPRGELAIQGLILDWKRFVTARTKSFMDLEIETVKAHAPGIPVTTNMIGSFPEIDYSRLSRSLDVASIDIYPQWGEQENRLIAAGAGFEYDVIRSLKRKSFLLMETTPSMTNWATVGKPKGPGLHMAGCLQAVAHGADSVQYFQWRKSRGAYEKFHGAVVGHCGHEHTRVFREVARLGDVLSRLGELSGAENRAQAAILYDWNNRWAIEGSKGPGQEKHYEETVREHYRAIRRYGINVDLIDEERSLDGYRMIAAPMLYLVRQGLTERLAEFVNRGGILLLTYFSGIVDENDLCFLGGFPGPLRDLAGCWAEELDVLYPQECNRLLFSERSRLKLSGEFVCREYCEVIHPEGAAVEAVYGSSWQLGGAALTSHAVGEGRVWYLATRAEEACLWKIYGELLREAGVEGMHAELPETVELSVREKTGVRYSFYTNWGDEEQTVTVPEGEEMIGGRHCKDVARIRPLETLIIKEERDLMER